MAVLVRTLNTPLARVRSLCSSTAAALLQNQFATGGLAVLAGGAVAAEPRAGLATGAWKLESLRLHDGRRLEGLVVEPTAAGEHRDPTAPIGFVQIVQPPGRMMELIT
jgi:hypothetical protein